MDLYSNIDDRSRLGAVRPGHAGSQRGHLVCWMAVSGLSPAQNRDLTGYLQRASSVDATSKPGGVTMNVQVNKTYLLRLDSSRRAIS